MKRTSLKLREAHKGNGSPAFCSVAWGADGRDLVTASASDPSILIHDASQLSSPPKELQYHKDGVTALALSPDYASLASGSIDHSVKIYSLPGISFLSSPSSDRSRRVFFFLFLFSILCPDFDIKIRSFFKIAPRVVFHWQIIKKKEANFLDFKKLQMIINETLPPLIFFLCFVRRRVSEQHYSIHLTN